MDTVTPTPFVAVYCYSHSRNRCSDRDEKLKLNPLACFQTFRNQTDPHQQFKSHPSCTGFFLSSAEKAVINRNAAVTILNSLSHVEG